MQQTKSYFGITHQYTDHTYIDAKIELCDYVAKTAQMKCILRHCEHIRAYLGTTNFMFFQHLESCKLSVQLYLKTVTI